MTSKGDLCSALKRSLLDGAGDMRWRLANPPRPFFHILTSLDIRNAMRVRRQKPSMGQNIFLGLFHLGNPLAPPQSEKTCLEILDGLIVVSF